MCFILEVCLQIVEFPFFLFFFSHGVRLFPFPFPSHFLWFVSSPTSPFLRLFSRCLAFSRENGTWPAAELKINGTPAPLSHLPRGREKRGSPLISATQTWAALWVTRFAEILPFYRLVVSSKHTTNNDIRTTRGTFSSFELQDTLKRIPAKFWGGPTFRASAVPRRHVSKFNEGKEEKTKHHVTTWHFVDIHESPWRNSSVNLLI